MQIMIDGLVKILIFYKMAASHQKKAFLYKKMQRRQINLDYFDLVAFLRFVYFRIVLLSLALNVLIFYSNLTFLFD